MTLELKSRRAQFIDIADEIAAKGGPLSADELATFGEFDLVYRSLCALLYNYVPTSGHPGGSISSGRFVFASIGFMSRPQSPPGRPVRFAAWRVPGAAAPARHSG